MRITRNRCAAVAASLALLAFPALARAGAADSQYQDPFAGENSGAQNQSSGGGGSGGGSGSASSQGSSSNQMSNSPPGSSSGSGRQVPRSGADPGLLALLGAGLVLTGAGLRVQLRRPVG